MDKKQLEAMRKKLRKEFAQQGGIARAKLPKERLQEIARAGANQRWANYRAAKNASAKKQQPPTTG